MVSVWWDESVLWDRSVSRWLCLCLRMQFCTLWGDSNNCELNLSAVIALYPSIDCALGEGVSRGHVSIFQCHLAAIFRVCVLHSESETPWVKSVFWCKSGICGVSVVWGKSVC